MPVGVVVAIAQGLLLGRTVLAPGAAATDAVVSWWAERISDDPSGWAFLLPAPTFVDERIGHDGSRPICTIMLRTTLRPTGIILRRRRKSLPLFGHNITLQWVMSICQGRAVIEGRVHLCCGTISIHTRGG